MVTTTAMAIAGLYLGCLLLLYTQQSGIIHQPDTPGRELVATPATIGVEWDEVWLEASDGIALHGWYLPGSNADSPTLLFFHGNAGNISHRLDSLALFHALGAATLIIDYRGYGRSEGAPSEAGLYRDATAAWDYLVAERGVPPERIVAFGRSLGGAMAAHVAAEREVGGLVLESAFTSLPALASEHYPVFPVRWLTRFEYPTRAFLERASAPVLIIHSPDDELIPYHHGRALYEAASGPKRFLAIEGGHNTGYMASREDYKAGLADFLACLKSDRPQHAGERPCVGQGR